MGPRTVPSPPPPFLLTRGPWGPGPWPGHRGPDSPRRPPQHFTGWGGQGIRPQLDTQHLSRTLEGEYFILPGEFASLCLILANICQSQASFILAQCEYNSTLTLQYSLSQLMSTGFNNDNFSAKAMSDLDHS